MKKIAILEGLRGWLALWVMVSHVLNYCAVAAPFEPQKTSSFFGKSLAVLSDGTLAVYIFMILSGFVNFYLLDQQRESHLVYLFRRFMRLYPLFIILFVVGIFATRLDLMNFNALAWGHYPWRLGVHTNNLQAFRFLLPNIIAHLAMLHGLVPPQAWPGANTAFLAPAWSISTEWQFYLVSPWLFRWAKTRAGMNLMGLGSVLVLLSVLRLPALQQIWNPTIAFLYFDIHLFYVGGASYFLYARLIGNTKPSEWVPSTFLWTALILVLLVALQPIILLWVSLFLLVLFAERFPQDLWIQRFSLVFTNRWSQYLGRISYSMYLFHWIVMLVVMRLLTISDSGITAHQALLVLMPTVLLVTVIGSGFLYEQIEKPFIKLGKELMGEAS